MTAKAAEPPVAPEDATRNSERQRDEQWMAVALEKGAAGTPSPNPHVGAILVKDGEIVGAGHHERAGEDHAEVVALREAGPRAKGATLYVTLEPCNHVGRTPPCTDAIASAGVSRVVIACRDPNPHVLGGGVEKLRAAGVQVDVGYRETEGRRLIAPWTKFVTTGMPYVTLKLGLSLDGRIASRTGASKWVTGPEARARVHVLRAQHDAVVVGIGTALADAPPLTVRDAPGQSPLRVIFDTKLRLPLAGRLVQSAREVPTWVVCTTDAPSSAEDQLVERGVEVLRARPSAEGRIDPIAALRVLATRGIVAAMIEGVPSSPAACWQGRSSTSCTRSSRRSCLAPEGAPGRWTGRARRRRRRLRASPTRNGRCAGWMHTSGDLCGTPLSRAPAAARLDGSAR